MQCPKNFKITKWQYLTMKHATTFFQARTPKKKAHLGVYMTIWSMGPRVLKKSIIIMPLKCWIIFLTMKSKKRRSHGERSHFDAKKMGLENGFHQKWVYDENAQNTRIKRNIDRDVEGKLRSLEKCFLWEEMVWWRRKIKGKKKVNSVNGGKEVDGRWSKKEKRRDKEVGGQNFGPHT